jgi:glutamate racemase
MDKTKPIGIFDSGVGGTSIWAEIHSLLPNEDTIYLADSINTPYGEKTAEEITLLSKKNTEYLLALGCKMIVVACNTATTNSIKHLRAAYDVPFIGIEPALKPAALHSSTHTIGILATKGTLSSELFHKAVLQFSDTRIIEQIGHGLVQLIEAGKKNAPEMRDLLHKYLNPMLREGIDYLVLGCSHYPYLIPMIRELIPASVTIIDSGQAVAKQTKRILEENNGLNNKLTGSDCTFYTNGDPGVLEMLLGHQHKVHYRNF